MAGTPICNVVELKTCEKLRKCENENKKAEAKTKTNFP